MPSFKEYFSYSLASMAYHTIRALGFAVIGCFVIVAIRAFLRKKILAFYPDPLRANAILRLLTYVMAFLCITVVLHEFQINVTGLLGAAGILSLAVGLAAQTSMSNMISGIFIILYHPFELGDQVIINTIEGKVKGVSLFAVTINTLDNKLVRIPNEQVIKSNIVNLSKEPIRGLQTILDITPESDGKAVISVITQLTRDRDYLLAEPAPFISVQELTGTYCRFVIIVWTQQDQWRTTRYQFLLDLKDAFDKAHIKLANPPIVITK